MRFLHLTFLYCMLNVLPADRRLENPLFAENETLKFITNPTTTNDVGSGATNIIYQSKDGGQTWQDISEGLPENDQPEGFFAGESDVYVRINNATYRSKSNLNSPIWVKENFPDQEGTSIVFNHSGTMAFSYE